MILAPITKKNYQIITSPKDAKKLIEVIRGGPDLWSYDTETTSIEPKLAKIIGTGVCSKAGTAYYLATRWWNPATQVLEYVFDNEAIERELLSEYYEVLGLKRIIMHNGNYDITATEQNYGIDLTWSLYADTIMMKHRIDEERPFGLKDLTTRYAREMGIPQDEIAKQEQIDMKASIVKNGGKITKDNYELYKGDMNLIGKYCCADADYTFRLFSILYPKLEKAGKLHEFFKVEEMPLMKYSTIPMKMRGIPINVGHFEKLKTSQEANSITLEKEVYELLAPQIEVFEFKTIDKAVNVRRTGDFALAGMEYFNLPVPKNRDGRPTMAKPAIEKLAKTYASEYLDWLRWNSSKAGPEPILAPEAVHEIKSAVYKAKNKDLAFNIRSPQHISWLLFDELGVPIDPTKVSKKTGKPAVDEEVLKSASHLKGIPEALALRKIDKQLSTYIRPILAKHINGWIYPDLKQHGTTSGRLAGSGGLNMQTLPRDDKSIKEGFIAPDGYKIVAADYSALEPRCFAWVSGDQGLIEIFQKNLDFYSKIAIDVYGLPELSADEKDPNFLKKLRPELRQATKLFALAVPYGANAYRLAMSSGRPVEEHQVEIDAYLDAYPELKKYMKDQETSAYKNGFVQTKFGKVRHLPKAKELFATHGKDIFNKFKMALAYAGPEGEELYEEHENIRADLYHPDLQDGSLSPERDRLQAELKKIRTKIEKLGWEGINKYATFRNCMNNAKNSPIQMTAAQVTNAAAIKFCKTLLKKNLDAWMCLNVHDELIAIAKEDQAEEVAAILKDSMENNWVTRRISVPIIAEPIIGNNFAECK